MWLRLGRGGGGQNVLPALPLQQRHYHQDLEHVGQEDKPQREIGRQEDRNIGQSIFFSNFIM